MRELASRAGVPVEEILFFDDAPHDCAAVERLGARGALPAASRPDGGAPRRGTGAICV